jgi:hypothetical protein
MLLPMLYPHDDVIYFPYLLSKIVMTYLKAIILKNNIIVDP